MPLLFLLATRLLAAQAEMSIDTSDDFAPGQLFIVLIAIGTLIILIGVGIFAAAVIAAATAIMVALGITSTAVLTGLLRRRFSSGLRVLHYQLFAVAAMPAGVGILWLGTWMADSAMRPRFILITGSLAGACAGLALAFSFDLLAKALYRRFVTSPDSTGITKE